MKITIISFTPRGNKLNLKLLQELQRDGQEAEGFHRCSNASLEELKGFESVRELTGELWNSREGLIFIGACGIAVRSIAPYLKGKEKDPCVLVIDENSRYVISLLSGHLGGGNKLSNKVADMLGAVPVVTTATDINKVFAVDLFAQKNNLNITELFLIKEISAALLADRTVGITSENPIEGELPEGLHGGADILGVYIGRDVSVNPYLKTLHLVPKNLILGLGCKKGVTGENLKLRVRECCEQAGLDWTRIRRICSIELKRNEAGLKELGESLKAELVFYTAEELKKAYGEFSASAFVEETAGVDNVCERSAALGSCYGIKKIAKTTGNGIALAVYESVYEIEI